MEKIERIEVLSVMLGIVAVFSTYLMLISIDILVNQDLYRYGLRFSYTWANPYWMYLRISLALLLVVTITIITLTVIARLQRIKLKMGTEELIRLQKKLRGVDLLVPIIAVAAVFSIYVLLLSVDVIVLQVLYRYGLRFSYAWANPYWMYLRISLALMTVTAVAIIALMGIVRHQRIKPIMGIEKKLIRLPKMRIEEELPKTEPKMWVEEQLARLRERLWRTRGRRSRTTGAALLILSGVFLFFAYSTRYIVFEVTSIVALLLGVIFVFVGVESYVKTRVADRAITSSLIPLSSFLSYFEPKGKAIYIPPTSEQGSGKIFISTGGKSSLPSFEEITKEDDMMIWEKGILLPSVGAALLRLYEEELGGLRNIDLNYLMEWLPRVLVEGLQISERMEITQAGDKIQVKLTVPAFRYVCQREEATKVVCETTGCPVCSSIAEALAKATGRIVYFLGCSYDLATRETTALFRLGELWKARS